MKEVESFIMLLPVDVWTTIITGFVVLIGMIIIVSFLVGGLQNRMKALADKLDEQKKRFAIVETKLAGLDENGRLSKEDLRPILHEVQGLRTFVNDQMQEHFNNVNQHLKLIAESEHRAIHSVQQETLNVNQQLQSRLADLQTRLSGISNLDSFDERLADLQTQLAAVSKLESIESQVAELKRTLSDFQRDMQDKSSNFMNIKDMIQHVKTSIQNIKIPQPSATTPPPPPAFNPEKHKIESSSIAESIVKAFEANTKNQRE